MDDRHLQPGPTFTSPWRPWLYLQLHCWAAPEKTPMNHSSRPYGGTRSSWCHPPLGVMRATLHSLEREQRETGLPMLLGATEPLDQPRSLTPRATSVDVECPVPSKKTLTPEICLELGSQRITRPGQCDCNCDVSRSYKFGENWGPYTQSVGATTEPFSSKPDAFRLQ